MNQSVFQLSVSWWWLILVIIGATLFAFFKYSIKKKPWTSEQNFILAIFHFFGVLLLLLLFLTPKIHQTVFDKIFPTYRIGIDNSSSVLSFQDSLQLKKEIKDISKILEEKEVKLEYLFFEEQKNIDSLRFDAKTSDLGWLMQQTNNSQDEHFVGGMLISDGIYNQGTSPSYQRFRKPIITVGLGDTTIQKDVYISRLRANRVSFLGNKIPIKVEISHSDLFGENVNVSVFSENGKLASKNITLNKKTQEITFLIPMQKKGINTFSVTAFKLPSESNISNNTKRITIDVIKDQHKVLVVSNAPHPDIKAIKFALENQKNMEVTVFNPSVRLQKYDVVIAHGLLPSQIPFKINDKTGVFYLVNARANFGLLNQSFPFLKIQRQSNRPDLVTGTQNSTFRKFEVKDMSFFENVPPVEVPFGEYTIGAGAEILMKQQLGNAKTDKPLMIYHDNGGKKSAIWFGQGFWKWRMQEMAVEETSDKFDELVSKTVQYLSLKNDKKQFVFKPTKKIFSTFETGSFEAEVYNDSYERIYGDLISIKITGGNGYNQSFSFSSYQNQSLFRLPHLASGKYSYQASVTISGKTFTSKGNFYIKEVDLESENTVANHDLLQMIAKKSNGSFYHFNQIEQLKDSLKKTTFKPMLKSREKDVYFRNHWLWYFLIFVCFSLEWFFRKYWGGY